MSKQSEALHWIVDHLNAHFVEYQIVGGLAAKAHGATRELADIDLYISYENAGNFLDAMRPYIYWGPQHYRDDHWDIVYLKIDYNGQKIEIGDSKDAFIFDAHAGKWIPQAIDYAASVRKNIYGCDIAVMPRDQLIAYKRVLGREVDLQDIAEMGSGSVGA